uniref:CinA family protein n=1 Tax=Escherichia coli TaxID=562 RepID=UPI001FCD0528
MNINSDKIVQLADTDTIENLTSALSQRLIADQLRLTTAESCTGGKLASALCAAEDTPKFYGAGFVLMNPLMILVKIIKLRWIHILSYDQMVSRKINNQTTRCANSIF